MRIDKVSRIFLDNLKSGNPDYPHDTYSYKHICQSFDMAEDTMLRIVKGLAVDGYLEFATWNGSIDMGVALTQKGYAYRELRSLEARERWKERFLGFLCGIATSLLVWWLITLLSGIL